MLCINDKRLEFVKIGLFDTDAPWIHPDAVTETHELIFVTGGEVALFEGEAHYLLHKGDAILLSPGVLHGGLSKSTGRTSFYWVHFHTGDRETWGLAKRPSLPPHAEKSLREIMHAAQSDAERAELLLAHLLLEAQGEGQCKSKLAHEVREYIRIHSGENLRVSEVAARFGYSSDHLSRLFRREFGVDLKTEIVKGRLLLSESMLLNTSSSVKEIATAVGFSDENLFSKFFKYHEGVTPSEYRNRFYGIHMNIN